jgi:tetratricopeptide (TPR) repeat protein
MLETIRGYAREVLDWAGNLEAVGRRHAGYFLELAETAERELRGGKQAEWLRRLEAEHDNLRVALNWAHERGEAHLELRLAGALGWFWLLRGYFTEGRTILRRTLSGTGGAPDARAKALAVEGMLAWRQGDLPRASSLLQDALALYEGLGDSVGAAHARHHLAHVHEARGDLTGAARLFEESLDVFRGCDDTWGLVLTLNCLGDALARRGDHERATALIEEGLTRATGAGDRHGMADALRLLGSERLHAGDDKRAVALLRESLALCRSLGDRQGTALSLRALTTASIQRGDYATARALAAESLRLAQEMGDGQGSIGDLATLAAVARREERFDHAATLLGTADALLQRLGASLSPCAQAESDRTQAVVRAHLGDDGFSARYGEGQALSLEEAAVRRLATER